MKENRRESVYVTVRKLLGKIQPTGWEEQDEEYRKNLEDAIFVVECLTQEIIMVSAMNMFSNQASKVRAYQLSDEFITRMKDVFSPN